MEQAATSTLGSKAEVTKVEHLGTGLSRSAWTATIVAKGRDSLEWVALVPLKSATASDHARFDTELELLAALGDRSVPFRIPEPVGTFRVDPVPVVITTWCYGLAYDRRYRAFMTGEQVLQTIARTAADIHRLPVDLPTPEPGFATARAHAEAALDQIRALEAIEMVSNDALENMVTWAEAQLPDPDEPARFLHGDLLPQNVLVHLEDPPAVIDWEYAKTGDPASDLAIVSRGDRKLFGQEGGVGILLDAYDQHADSPVLRERHLLHELALMAGQATFAEENDNGLVYHHWSRLLNRWNRSQR